VRERDGGGQIENASFKPAEQIRVGNVVASFGDPVRDSNTTQCSRFHADVAKLDSIAARLRFANKRELATTGQRRLQREARTALEEAATLD
jgi:hypothetical protein